MPFDVQGLQADYAKQLWTLSGVVCGFSVLQTLSFLYAMQRPEFRQQILDAHPLVPRAILASSAIYTIGILILNGLQASLLAKLEPNIESVTWAACALEVAAVWICGTGAFALASSVKPTTRAARWYRKWAARK